MNITQELKESIRKALPNLDLVIGWSAGFDPLHATPLFIRDEADIDRLEISPLSVHNLATYLPGLRGKKVGIIVKGCDSRSVVELLQEKLINWDDITVFGFPCKGVVDQAKIRMAVGDVGNVESCVLADGGLTLKTGFLNHTLQLNDVLAEKCLSCSYPNAVISDHFVGEKIEVKASAEQGGNGVDELEALPLRQRFNFWLQEMDRCIRCYACRNACPLCVCRDHCAAESREPHWLSQENHVRDKWLFQVIHAYHLAGRCTECGECQRACPVDIPVLLLKKKINREIKEIFDYEAGIDPEKTPPLLSFNIHEENIAERKW